MNTTIKNLNELEDKKVESMEQDFTFKIGKEGFMYEADIERDCEGNITDVTEHGLLDDKVNWDTEDSIAHAFMEDAYIWADLDQEVFDADASETVIYYVDVAEFIKNNFFDDEEMDFIKEHEEEGYMRIYVTVTENRIFEEE